MMMMMRRRLTKTLTTNLIIEFWLIEISQMTDGDYDDDVCFGDNVMNTQWARNLFLVKIPKI